MGSPGGVRRAGRPAPVPVVKVSAQELRERRIRLLAQLGMSFDEVRAGAAAYTLTRQESEVWQELRHIAFLLREERQPFVV